MKKFKLKDGRELSCLEISMLANIYPATVRIKLKKGMTPDEIIEKGNCKKKKQYEGKPCRCGCGVIVKKNNSWGDSRRCRYTYYAQQRKAGLLKPDGYSICKQCGKEFPVFKVLNTLNNKFCTPSCGTKYQHRNKKPDFSQLCFQHNPCLTYQTCSLKE